jgi:hypothetical protein
MGEKMEKNGNQQMIHPARRARRRARGRRMRDADIFYATLEVPDDWLVGLMRGIPL